MDRCLVRWLLSAVAIIACVESHGSPADFDFIGSSHWAQSYRQTCENPPTRYHENPSLLCYRRFVRLSPVDIEVLSRFPLLLHYHKLITADNARSFVRMAEARTITEQLVVQDDNPKIHQTHDSRRANGTWMRHEEEGIVRTLYRQVQERLALNLRAAEDWQVLRLYWSPSRAFYDKYSF
uniref:Uncharacterized protein n=1 Tax=Plectus sambesii TaxID=2011161 RepID=A0A914XP83_9BILA